MGPLEQGPPPLKLLHRVTSLGISRLPYPSPGYKFSRGQDYECKSHQKGCPKACNMDQGQTLQVSCVKTGCPKSNRKQATRNPSGPEFVGKLHEMVPRKQPKTRNHGTVHGQISEVSCVRIGAPKAAEDTQHGTLQDHISYVNCTKKAAPKAADR